jgi:HD-GYP domain-containing protein (c-di-GMP phosphodiesterase class II)
MVSKVFFTMRLGGGGTRTGDPADRGHFASLRNPHAFNGLMACRRNAEFVYRHALATSALMITLARQIGLPVEMIHEAGVAGLLMDAGVNLLPVDFEAHGGLPGSIPPHIWRDHVRFGHDFVLGGAFGEAISRAVLEHHERMDGTGYPSGMRGDELSLLGRMAAICDSFDNLLNGFEADHAMGPAEALAAYGGRRGRFRSGTAGRVYRRHGALSGGVGGGTGDRAGWRW